MLRDGGYVSERDAFMKLEGLYVAATGRLHAVLNPVDDVQLSLAQEDLDMHTADYRWAGFTCCGHCIALHRIASHHTALHCIAPPSFTFFKVGAGEQWHSWH